jgi:hypothetical protein
MTSSSPIKLEDLTPSALEVIRVCFNGEKKPDLTRGKDNTIKVWCSGCGSRLTHRIDHTNSNLLKHLKNDKVKHAQLLQRLAESGKSKPESRKRSRDSDAESNSCNAAKQLKFEVNTNSATLTMNVNSYCKKAVDDALCALIIGKSLPFELTESAEFRHFVKCLNKGYKTPCSHTLTKTMIPTHYKEVSILYLMTLKLNQKFY